ncbi:hypothetical protein GCM10007423_39550 [Dyadobacter endophyticus]|uniref:Uncharacterized protein n=1 Tax=Dyadobacter endophyticus TaxID=1749036 RepID=A0ABQ1Z0M2_9BACT|nr:hypothetical protein [Dyadobacter endophyticus]GGH42729.1 hypothetical protein GCM10007423_39550 [Dyadobacter endophyticus]
MRQAAIFITLAVASMAGKYLKSAIDTLTWPALTGIALTMFSGFFIFTVMTAKSPVQFKWKPQVRISPEVMELLRNLSHLMGVLLIMAATAVILVAIAATGPDLTFTEAVLMMIKSLPRMLDV